MERNPSLEMLMNLFLDNASKDDLVFFIKLLEEKRIEAGKKLLTEYNTELTNDDLCVVVVIPALREEASKRLLELQE